MVWICFPNRKWPSWSTCSWQITSWKLFHTSQTVLGSYIFRLVNFTAKIYTYKLTSETTDTHQLLCKWFLVYGSHSFIFLLEFTKILIKTFHLILKILSLPAKILLSVTLLILFLFPPEQQHHWGQHQHLLQVQWYLLPTPEPQWGPYGRQPCGAV